MSEIYSDLKIFKHMDRLDGIQNKILVPPIMARIKPTNICDQHCFYCSTPVKATYVKDSEDEFVYSDSIKWNVLKNTINDLANIGTKSIIFSGGGEPLVYPKINDAIKLVFKRELDLGLITNGWKLTKDRAKLLRNSSWIRLSIDTSDPAKYSEYRKIKQEAFNELVDNIKYFVSIKKGTIGINYVVHKYNFTDIYNTVKFFKSIGIDNIKFSPLVYKDAPIEYHNSIRDIVNKSISNSKKEFEDDSFKVINRYDYELDASLNFTRTYDSCSICRLVTSIAANGKVYLCHDKAYMKGNDIGNVYNNTFNDIWFSNKTKEIFDSLNPIEKCKHHCIWDKRNMLMNNYFNAKDINFI